MVVITDELDKYSAKKHRTSGIMKGRIFQAILSFSPNGDLWASVTTWSVVSEVEATIVYSTSMCPVGLLYEPFVMKSLSNIA